MNRLPLQMHKAHPLSKGQDHHRHHHHKIWLWISYTEAATQALRDNRMYAPAGNNAVEYYLALREKQPQDAIVNSALTDLLPYTLIAAEQSIHRKDFDEARRLRI